MNREMLNQALYIIFKKKVKIELLIESKSLDDYNKNVFVENELNLDEFNGLKQVERYIRRMNYDN